MLPKVHVGYFTAAKNYRYFRLISLFQETAYMLDFEQKVMLVGLRTEFYLLHLDLYLLFLGFLQFLALLIFEFAVVHDPANRRHGSGRHFDKVQLLAFRKRKRFLQLEDPQLFAVGPYYPDLFRPDGLININRGFSYDATS